MEILERIGWILDHETEVFTTKDPSITVSDPSESSAGEWKFLSKEWSPSASHEWMRSVWENRY
jgi:hypothetical protein